MTGRPGHATVVVPPSAARRVPRDASDARAHPILDGAWCLQLPLPYISVASANAHLLATDDGWILIDCGSCLPPGWDAMEVALRHAGAAPEDLELVVVTHSHADHRGLAADIVERTGCDLAVGEGPHPILDVLRDPSIPLDARRARALREGVPSVAVDVLVDDLPGGDGLYPHAEPDRVLAAGDQLQSRSGTWEVIRIPGHSADQIALWNARHRRLISADLALPGPASFLEYGTRPDPHADQLAALGRAIELEPEVILPGHGRPVPDGVSYLRRCRDKVLDRVDAVRDSLRPTAVSGWDVAALMTPSGADSGHWQRSLAESLSVLEHLEAHGSARSRVDDDGTRRWQAPRA